MSDKKATPPLSQEEAEAKAPWVCPFSRIDETSQVLRRHDLLALGDTFKEALGPAASLVPLMQQQNTNSVELLVRMDGQAQRMDRLQRWMFYLLVMSWVALVVQVGVVLSIRQVVVQVGETANDLDSMASTVQSAKVTAEATQKEVAEVSSAQANQPRLELVPEEDPERAKDAPVRVRIVAPRTKPSSGTRGERSPQKLVQPPQTAVEIPVPKEGLTDE